MTVAVLGNPVQDSWLVLSSEKPRHNNGLLNDKPFRLVIYYVSGIASLGGGNRRAGFGRRDGLKAVAQYRHASACCEPTLRVSLWKPRRTRSHFCFPPAHPEALAGHHARSLSGAAALS